MVLAHPCAEPVFQPATHSMRCLGVWCARMRPGGPIRPPVQCMMHISNGPFGVKEGPKRGSDITIRHPTEDVGQDRFQTPGSSELLFPVFWYPVLIPTNLLY